MQQEAILKKINKLKNPVLARKYIATDKGLIFIVFAKTKNGQPDKILNLVKTTDEIFLASGDIYMSLTSAIIKHLKRIMQNQKNIIITLAENIPENDEIKI